ncbi:hypothetical protein LVJ94_23480 [Pendulispora rubella]|uniref:Uncharacterized protein n=1 Tax=Pendulispora rubella TaxID=2741070 RepID=A0ABZ2LGX8_9BACT
MRARYSLGWTSSIIVSACLAGGCVTETPEPSDVARQEAPLEDDILEQLRHVPGVVQATEIDIRPTGPRSFVIRFEQPVDHHHPDGPKFTERFSMLYRSRDLPMVIDSTGYALRSLTSVRPNEPTRILASNEILLEHRFFGESVPSPVDYSNVTSFQSASDEHRIIEALRPLFPKKWLSTGASKGGMTAMSHRYFYPDDVYATIAYVAPLNFDTSDPRYVAFLEHVGDASCRQKLKDFQVELLRRRAEIEPLMLAEAAASGDSYEALGIHRALDVTVTEAPFFFWQYSGTTCADVPPSSATTQQLFDVLQNGIYYPSVSDTGFGDKGLFSHAAGLYQAATEHGYAGFQYAHTRPYLTPGFFDEPAIFPPFGVEKRYSPLLSMKIGAWSYGRAERVILVYGENDPWSAGAFSVSRSNDSYRYIAPQTDHSAGIWALGESDRAEAVATLRRWMDVPSLGTLARSAKAAPEPTDLPRRF